MNKFFSINTRKVLLNIGIIIISLVASIFIMDGLVYIGDEYNIPLLNTKSMVHLTIFFLFPIASVINYLILSKIINNTFIETEELEGKKSIRISLIAILSFIFSCLGFIPFVSVVAIILGHIALKKIRVSSNVRGKGFAIMGLVFGYCWLAHQIYIILFLKLLR